MDFRHVGGAGVVAVVGIPARSVLLQGIDCPTILSAMATMRDVAALAGVSIKTVSRVVNGEPHTSRAVIDKVHAAADQLGWTPNSNARNLRTGRTGVIAIAATGLRRPTTAQLVEVLVEEIRRRGLEATVEPTEQDPRRIEEILTAIGTHHDGAVLVQPPEVPFMTGRSQLPVVVLQGYGAAVPFDRVDEDVETAATLVARHLSLMGRSRPAVLGRDRGTAFEEGSNEGASRLLLAALQNSGIRVPHFVPIVDQPDRRAGLAAAASVLKQYPDTDSLICANDEVGLGALTALELRGIACPDQVAVVGHGNLIDSRFAVRSLTTLDHHPLDLARATLDLLAERISGSAPTTARAVTIPVTLLRRESTMGRR